MSGSCCRATRGVTREASAVRRTGAGALAWFSSKVWFLVERKRRHPICLNGFDVVRSCQRANLFFLSGAGGVYYPLNPCVLPVSWHRTSRLWITLLSSSVGYLIPRPVIKVEKNHFYLTLPSNSSMALFPENAMSDYTTKLPRDFALVGSWEVAVSEIMYPNTWNNILDGREYYVKVAVSPPNEADLKTHLKRVTTKIPRLYFFSSPTLWIANVRREPLRTLCLTASVLENVLSALQSPSSISGLVKISDDCSALKRVTSLNPGLFTAGYL